MKLFNPKYKFFKDKVTAVTKTIWDAEFKIEKSRQVREGVRQDRDRALEAVGRIDAQIATEKDKANLETLEGNKKQMQEEVARYEAQMKMIDDQVNGAEATKDSDMVIGLMEQVKSLVELREMYKSYLTKI